MNIVADTNIPFAGECFSSLGEVTLVPGGEITPGAVRDAQILLVRSITRVDSKLLDGSSIRFVGTSTIGFDHVDVDYLAERDIGFASAPGSNANSVAEYVIAGLFEVAKKNSIELQGKSIGVIGVGNIGSRVVEKCSKLGMQTYLNDPPLARESGDEKYLSLKDLFDCDFITLHTPLTFDGVDKTFHLADEKFFKSLKEGGVFINTSRGGVAETGALKEAIKNGRLGPVVLDVWEDEPDIDTGLLEMVDIGTPHIAGYSFDGKVEGMIMIYKAVCEHFGLEPKFDAESFLPEPAVPELQINTQLEDLQGALPAVVRKIYDIKADDFSLRRILNMPRGKRCGLFDQLRKNYPVRREFQNTQVVFNAPCEKLAEMLKGIGFKVLGEKE
ncbi:MAG: 4-phosphoerythronate dehydrogenase PdxB [Planctomycetota bacterium]|jgi:erythronate-4-phosphate dehydrogenase